MRNNKQAGQALVLAAIALVVLTGFAGLAIDMGVLRHEKRLQQTAADSAAIAGAEELRYSGGSGITPAALKAAAANGFSDTGSTCSSGCPSSGGVGYVTVTINNPPSSGPHKTDAHYVEALVAKVQPTYFMKVLGVNSETITARAVATLVGENATAPGCIYTLGPPGTGIGVTNAGTPYVNAPTCGIEDSGDWTTNGATVDINAGNIGVVGTSTNHGGGTVTCGGSTSNCPQTGIPPSGDPLSFLTPPCTSCSGGSALTINSNQTVSPGTYSSIRINGGTVDFSPGTYIINGDFAINGAAVVCSSVNSNCSGMPSSANSGVTFYITGGGAVTINGTSTVELSAPNSGTYSGILFYQDPSDTSAATLNGTNASYYQGALYFPAAQLNFGGTNFTNSVAKYTIIVADDLKFFGTSQVNIQSDYSSLPGGVSIIKNAILVE